MLFVYLLFCALCAYVVFSDGGEILAEHLLPLLLPHIAHDIQQVRRTTGVLWVVFSLLAFWRGWL